MRQHGVGMTVAAAAGVAAVTYGGYATAAWLKYGRHEPLDRTTLLDSYMPEPEIVERQEIEVHAPADVAYAASRNLDLMHSPFIRLIFETRACVMGSAQQETELPRPLIEQVKVLGWNILDELPGREIVVGAAAKPWQADVGFRAIPAGSFATFDEPGWAKIVFNFSVEPLDSDRTMVRTETRVATTDDESRRRFRRYWAFVSPGIILIRFLGLKMVKIDAEKGVLAQRAVCG